MPPFTRRKPETASAETETATTALSTANPNLQLADAEAALNRLLGEQAEVQQNLLDHQLHRERLLRDDGDLEEITALDRLDYQLRLRLQQLELQLPALQLAVQQAQIAVHEQHWQAYYRPVLVEAEQRLVAAISELHAALAQVQDVHAAAHRAGFASRLNEFLNPPPSSPINDYSLREYAKAAPRRSSMTGRTR